MIVCLLPGGQLSFSVVCFFPLSIPNNNQARAGGGMSSLDLWSAGPCAQRGVGCVWGGVSVHVRAPRTLSIKDAATASCSLTPKRIPTAVRAVL